MTLGEKFSLWGLNSGQKIMQKILSTGNNEIRFRRIDSESFLICEQNSKDLGVIDIKTGNRIKNFTFDNFILDFAFVKKEKSESIFKFQTIHWWNSKYLRWNRLHNICFFTNICSIFIISEIYIIHLIFIKFKIIEFTLCLPYLYQ